jgi:hypothetical protein
LIQIKLSAFRLMPSRSNLESTERTIKTRRHPLTLWLSNLLLAGRDWTALFNVLT